MISIAELVALPFLLAILVQWARTERAETVVLDRRLEAELVPATPAPGAAQTSELVRPWWETENSEVAQRIRHQRPGR
jgi:putative copper resistance protein D